MALQGLFIPLELPNCFGSIYVLNALSLPKISGITLWKLKGGESQELLFVTGLDEGIALSSGLFCNYQCLHVIWSKNMMN